MINIRYGKNISFVWVITLNGQEVDLTGHTVQVELTLPNNNKVIIKPTVDYNILTFDYQGHNVGRHFLTCYLDRNTPNELMCDDKYGFNLVAQSWMEDDSLAGDVQTESINLSWNISNDAATKGWVKAQQYLNARDLEDYDFASRTELNEGLDTKQDKLTAGANITISGNTISAKDTTYTAGENVHINGTVISATDTNTTYSAGTGLALNGTTFSVNNTIATKNDLNAKQDKLTAGSNIQINGNTISATDTKYTAGTNVQINNKVISATDTKYSAGTGLALNGTTFSVNNTIATKSDLNAKQDKLTAGSNIQINGNTISATDTKYTAGENITIENNVISSTGGATYTASAPLNIDANDNISIDLSDYATKNDLNDKQDTLTAGANITIDNNTISATDTTYSAGNGLSLSGTEFAVDTTVVATQTDLSGKQDTLTAGSNITINNDTISATDTTYSAGTGLDLTGTEFSVDTTTIATKTDLNSKQDTLTAGSNITITNNTISATDTTYTAGDGLDFANNEFSVNSTIARVADLASKQDVLTPGNNITISSDDVISATDTTYTAGNGLDLTGTQFSVDTTVVATQNDLSGKQDTLTAGSNISINNNTISATDTTYSAGTGLSLSSNEFSVDTTTIATKNDLSAKQDTLTAGNNITISNNTISATDTTYTAGDGLDFDNNEFSVDSTIARVTDLASKQDVLTPGNNITISSDDVISATDTTYTAGNGLDLTGTQFSVDTTTIATKNDLSAKQDTLTAGTNITINNNTISATDTTYSAGTGISIDANNVISATGGSDEHDYSKDYLTFVALADGTFSFTRTGTTADVYYSVDNGTTWTVLASGTSTPTVTTGNKILWKSDRTNDTINVNSYNTFNATANFNAEGNTMSMLYGDNFADKLTLLGTDTLYRLFNNNKKIINAEKLILPATTLTKSCYHTMFSDCSSLTTAPELPATTLAAACYQSMFNGCRNILNAPYLPALTVPDNAYRQMFGLGIYEFGNASLQYIKMDAITIEGSALYKWMDKVSPTGTFVKNINATWTDTGVSGVPTGWTVKYENTGYTDKTPTDGSMNAITSDAVYDALATKQDTLTAGSNITISSNTISATDTTYTAGTGISIDANNVISATGGGGDVPYEEQYLTFVALEDGTFTLTKQGDTSDAYYSVDNGTTWTLATSGTSTPTITTGNKILWKSDRTSEGTIGGLFAQNKFSSTGAFKAEGNVLSMWYGDNFDTPTAFNTYNSAFRQLFYGANYLTDASNMIIPDVLPDACCQMMFSECYALTAAPKLPATTVKYNCYKYMFDGCYSLTTAPELPAATLVESCYEGMFNGCSSLNYIKMLATDTSNNAVLNNWTTNVSTTGTIVLNVATDLTTTGSSGIPSGWTVAYEETGYVDKTPTSNSNNTVTSGAVYTALQNAGQTYTAGTGLSLSNNEFSVDTTTIATKSYVDTQVGDITNILATI